MTNSVFPQTKQSAVILICCWGKVERRYEVICSETFLIEFLLMFTIVEEPAEGNSCGIRIHLNRKKKHHIKSAFNCGVCGWDLVFGKDCSSNRVFSEMKGIDIVYIFSQNNDCELLHYWTKILTRFRRKYSKSKKATTKNYTLELL